MMRMKNKQIDNPGETYRAYLFMIPLLVVVFLFVLLPVAATMLDSFFRDVTFLPKKFIGFKNYRYLLQDLHFWQSATFTLLFVIVSISIELVLGMIFALILNEKMKFRAALSIILLIPWAIPVAVSARIWQIMYSYDFGAINFILLKTGIISEPVNWLGSPASAFFALLLSDVWKTTPFMTIILLAGLASIPPVIYKQAMIDGARFDQKFFRITLPLLKPVLIVALLFRTIDAVRIFDLVYVLTGGGPGGSTASLSLYAYKNYVSGDFGYGSAVSMVIFCIAFGFSILYVKLGKFSEVAK
jgi:multiple sugar transport system permease protein